MKYLVQRPLPDELLGSVWLRTVRRTGLPAHAVARAITGRKWAPGFFQVAHVFDLAPLLRMDPMALLWGHSVFPYATAYFEQSVFDAALQAALASGIAAVGMGAVTQSVSDLVPFRRYCAACTREDRHRWGESYWHRAHNLPGVLLCLRHGTVLRQTDWRTTGARSWDPRLPQDARGARLLHRPLSSFDRKLAAHSVELLNRDAGTQVDRKPEWYRAQLLELGLLTPTRRVNAEKLAQWARNMVGASRLRYGLAHRQTDFHWLAPMVRPRSSYPVIPLKHLMLGTALALHRPTDGPLLDHVPSGFGGRSKEEQAKLDRRYATAVRLALSGYIRRGERMRIQDALAEVGCWDAFRHDRAGFPRTNAAVQALVTSPASMRVRTAGRRTERCRGST